MPDERGHDCDRHHGEGRAFTCAGAGGEWANKWRIAPQPVTGIVAQEILFAQPYLVDKGMCVAMTATVPPFLWHLSAP